MKTIIRILVVGFLAFTLNLKVSSQETEVFTLVETMPEFPGGNEALKEFISENIIYPAEAKAEGIQGKVFVAFTINHEGKVKDAEVVKGVHKLLDAEALRVVKEMPEWQPGEEDGKPVNVRYTLPVIFKLGAKPGDN